MRYALLLSLMLAGGSAALAQAPATQTKPQSPPTTTAKPPAGTAQQPAKPQPAAPRAQQPARRAQPAGRSGIAVTVTDPAGATLGGVNVHLMGPTERTAETNDSGQVNFTQLQAGTYRLRFSGDTVVTLERDVTLAAGRTADVDVTLNEAPPPRVVEIEKPAPAPASTGGAAGPVGQPQTLNVADILEKNFIGRQPRRETLISCSGNVRTTMLQLNEPQPDLLYDTGDASYYVLAGEGTARIDGREIRLETNGFVSVPRGTTHSFTRRGNRPLVLLTTLGGPPCEEAR
jgi:mannose-6-phosphate isomerase-like protein (cupin superfamily)